METPTSVWSWNTVRKWSVQGKWPKHNTGAEPRVGVRKVEWQEAEVCAV